MDREKKIKRNILNFLKKHREGITITDVSSSLGIHYITATKYLAVLEAEGKLTHRKIGMAKLFKTRR
jgi:predicted ArsR family transcriptional regulator